MNNPNQKFVASLVSRITVLFGLCGSAEAAGFTATIVLSPLLMTLGSIRRSLVGTSALSYNLLAVWRDTIDDVKDLLEEEVDAYLNAAITTFLARIDAHKNTDSFARYEAKARNELKLYAANVENDMIEMEEAVRSYTIMANYMAWVEAAVAKDEAESGQFQRALSVAERIHAVLAPSPSKRSRPRNYLAKGTTQQSKSKDKGGKGTNRERKQEAAYV